MVFVVTGIIFIVIFILFMLFIHGADGISREKALEDEEQMLSLSIDGKKPDFVFDRNEVKDCIYTENHKKD